MRHPDQFCVGFDIAMTDGMRREIAKSKKPFFPTMHDDNIHYLFQPEINVLYLMVEHNLSRGEAEFILHWQEY